MPLHIESPLLQSRPLSILSGKSVWLKFDALQPSGSFKLRGIGAVCEEYARQGKTRFISSSGGNAGIAVAYAGRQLSIPVTVVVPETTTLRAKTLIEQEGASVIVHGASWMEANALAQSMLDASSAFVHPFDNPTMWSGHATMIDEVARANVPFDSVLVSVGGGGLLSGVIEGLQRNGLGHVPVVAIETDGADSLARSVAAGTQIELEAITSVATSLGAKKVCANAFEVTRSHDVRCHVVSDLEALEACESFLHDHRVLVEPACGATLAAVYGRNQSMIAEFKAPLAIVCGGATATLEQIQEWRAKAAAAQSERAH
ncbi:pyridoxal-phosphate dependent enzyme [Paraburkholderia sp. Tr-20389]|uniref:pyridoxal-phosphate dependent enzyme n=1 Tax=Paraburkholderia sp. Tr-20389 TaxID=2703903 RepID=UPI00197D64F7|nr:pyridoxal-phosphate dependent enzyme [Paraburkholderia sp. Tr-20389]MBN3754368.1 pyridoxal-phosphate dependent enzyme [Paraburkholderia sp. Tr-20389]